MSTARNIAMCVTSCMDYRSITKSNYERNTYKNKWNTANKKSASSLNLKRVAEAVAAREGQGEAGTYPRAPAERSAVRRPTFFFSWFQSSFYIGKFVNWLNFYNIQWWLNWICQYKRKGWEPGNRLLTSSIQNRHHPKVTAIAKMNIQEAATDLGSLCQNLTEEPEEINERSSQRTWICPTMGHWETCQAYEISFCRMLFKRRQQSTMLLPSSAEKSLKAASQYGKDVLQNLWTALQIMLPISVSVASCKPKWSRLNKDTRTSHKPCL